MASPRPFFLTASSSDDHSSQEDDSPRPRNNNNNNKRPPPSSFIFPYNSDHRRSLDGNPFDSPRLPSPNPPFLSESPYKSFNGSFSLSNLNRSPTDPQLPRNSSATTIFRSPFLSPASRPSTIWSPPPVPSLSASPSVIALPLTQKKPLQSTRLKSKLTKEDKPWLTKKRRCETGSWWVTFVTVILGFLAAAALCFQGWNSVNVLEDSQLCIVMDDEFSTGSLDDTNWTLDVELGGFGNGEFEMTTNSDSNVYISNGQLYIMPTLTSDSIPGGWGAVMNNGSYQLQGCTAQGGGNFFSSYDPCTAISNAQSGTVINPVMSGRLNTRGKRTMKYGRVEVRAKLPQGDWLWPAIWMLPQGNSTNSNTSQGTGVYGPWPVSGEIDIMEARGNLPTYPAQGSNYVRSSLNYGPFAGGIPQPTFLKSIYGWVFTKRGNFADGFHVYAFEWTGGWMRFYTDDRLQAMINLDISSKSSDSYFFNAGGFPGVAMNAKWIVEDLWSTAFGGSAAAPFDQDFYLVIDLAVGGTSGWFPDSVGGKPWFDGSTTAMHDFANAQDTWSATWPSSADDRAFRIDYVKMWKLCGT
ncbi:glycoside hydrolase family 16 protein [Suillus subluteus]|nr:glycoside hydrolase family 16 protein [Suillus subluteus]